MFPLLLFAALAVVTILAVVFNRPKSAEERVERANKIQLARWKKLEDRPL